MRLRRRSAPFVATATAAVVAMTGLVSVPAAAAEEFTPFISEIHYDNVGADQGEAVEIEAPAGFDLTGWKIVRYNGNVADAAVVYTSPGTINGTSEDLSGNAPPPESWSSSTPRTACRTDRGTASPWSIRTGRPSSSSPTTACSPGRTVRPPG